MQKDAALFAVELCTELSFDDFKLTPVMVATDTYSTLGSLEAAGEEIFTLTKNPLIRQIARSAREAYPTSKAWNSSVANLIVAAVSDVRDDGRLEVIAESVTPDGQRAVEAIAQLDGAHVANAADDAFEVLLSIVANAAKELLDGMEIRLASAADGTDA